VALADSPELLTDGDRAGIAAALQVLTAAKAGTDHLAIRAAVEGLDRASKDFAARRMNRALDAGLRGQTVAAVEAKVAETAPKTELAARMEAHGHGGPGHSHG
jgi:DNA primase